MEFSCIDRPVRTKEWRCSVDVGNDITISGNIIRLTIPLIRSRPWGQIAGSVTTRDLISKFNNMRRERERERELAYWFYCTLFNVEWYRSRLKPLCERGFSSSYADDTNLRDVWRDEPKMERDVSEERTVEGRNNRAGKKSWRAPERKEDPTTGRDL